MGGCAAIPNSMKQSRFSPVLLVTACVGAASAGAAGCGNGDDVSMGELPAGGQGSGGSLSLGSNSGSGGSVSGTDTCGGQPCSNHTGTHDFVEMDAPGNAPELFGGGTKHDPGTNAGNEPAIVYPNHETMFPINVSRIRHEWSGGAGNGVFMLRFEGPNTTVNVYTSSVNWLPSPEQWDWIAESNRGAEVTLTVHGLDPAAPADVWQSAPITLMFSQAEVEGAIYYWSTGTQGVMKALVSDPVPIKFYTDPQGESADKCVACHTLSRDGKRLAVGYEGETLWEASVPERERILPLDSGTGGTTGMPPAKGDGMASAWTTFSPDGEMLLVAAAGILTLIDSDTGAPIGENSGVVPIPEGSFATHPDWAALGDRVAVTLGTSGGNKEVEGGSIALLPYNDGAWGEPEILVASTGLEDNNFFPVWSPDSRWIAYANAAGKSKDAISATLRLISADGGAPILMPRVNERVNNEDGVTGIGNTMPTWAPSTRPGTFWLAFSSLRAYATVRPQDEKIDQIWIAAIDPTLPDPGYAGFWAPFQNVEDGNHRAFWTHTDEDTQCRCQDECGDGLDNDCDGTADEADCATCEAAEICGDGIDNNCDCVIDDCNVEICDDGVDNDGDGLADSEDPACIVQ
jgi:WD40-like Beta Propeller Repeat